MLSLVRFFAANLLMPLNRRHSLASHRSFRRPTPVPQNSTDRHEGRVAFLVPVDRPRPWGALVEPGRWPLGPTHSRRALANAQPPPRDR